MRSQRPGRKVFKNPGPDLGVKVIEPGFPSAAGGWWDDFGDPAIAACAWAAYQPKGAASLAVSYIDLTGNGNNCGPGVAPGWGPVNGWMFNGINQWLDTNFVPQNDQSQSMLVQFTNVGAAGNRMMIGQRTLPAIADYYLTPNFGFQVIYANGGGVATVPGLLAGNLGIAGNQGYRNGVADGGLIGGYTNPAAQSVYIGCWNNNGVAQWFLPVNIQAVALYDCALTAPQMAAVEAWMAAI